MAQRDFGEAAPPGWYADSDPTQQRWWNGQNWSELTRLDPGPPDLRGRRLLLTGVTLLTVAVVAGTVAYPWIAGDPVAGQPNEPVAPWAHALSLASVVALGLGIIAFTARWFVRRRTPSDLAR